MTVEKKIEALEGELKLMKGELKETLTGVRDFLLELKLPLASGGVSLDGDGAISFKGGLTIDSPSGGAGGALGKRPEEKPAQKAPQTAAPEGNTAAPAASGSQESPLMTKNTSYIQDAPGRQLRATVSRPAVQDAPPSTVPGPDKVVQNLGVEERPEDKEAEDKTQKMEKEEKEETTSRNNKVTNKEDKNKEDKMEKDEVPAGPQVNLLVNLIRWVSVARSEIGRDQLQTFLDVYAISGNLSPELKAVILHLADVVQPSPDAGDVYGQLISEQLAALLDIHSLNGQLSPELREGILNLTTSIARQSSQAKASDVWSRLMLELHGILAGGGAPVHFSCAFWDGKEKQPETDVKPEAAAKPPAEAKKPLLHEGKPVRLKVVVPSNGGEEEFDIEEFSVSLD